MEKVTETINERRSTVLFSAEEIDRRIEDAALKELNITPGKRVKVSVVWPKNPMTCFAPQTVTVSVVEDMGE